MSTKFSIIGGRCVIPEGVTEIEDSAFEFCNELQEIVIPASVARIGACAFSECSNLSSVTFSGDGLTDIGTAAFFYCTHLTEIHLPDSVLSIGAQAFEGCCSIREFVLPEGVREIGTSMLCYCTALEFIEVDEENPKYKSESNCCLTKDGKTLVFGCKSSVIPSSVECIDEFAFFGCSDLKTIVIPDSVKLICYWAFGDCSHLTSINIPANVKEVEICTFSGAPIKDIFLAAEKPEDCADLSEALKYNRIKNITLHVPDGSGYAYGQHPFFKKFSMISEHVG